MPPEVVVVGPELTSIAVSDDEFVVDSVSDSVLQSSLECLSLER